MEYAMELRNLRKEYKQFTLDNISLSLPMGSIMGFIGENGAGKSTTIKAMLGLIRPEAAPSACWARTPPPAAPLWSRWAWCWTPGSSPRR